MQQNKLNQKLYQIYILDTALSVALVYTVVLVDNIYVFLSTEYFYSEVLLLSLKHKVSIILHLCLSITK